MLDRPLWVKEIPNLLESGMRFGVNGFGIREPSEDIQLGQ